MKSRGNQPRESDSDIDHAPADDLDADGGVKRKKYGEGRNTNSSFT